MTCEIIPVMRILIGISLLLAFILTVFPIHHEWRWYRPEFVALLVIYWSMFVPQHFGLMAAWCVGLYLDVLLLSPLGLHATSLLLIAWLSPIVHGRIKNYVLWHQALWIFILIALFQLFSRWLGSFFGQSADTPIFLLAALFSALLWPPLVLLIKRLLTGLHLLPQS